MLFLLAALALSSAQLLAQPDPCELLLGNVQKVMPSGPFRGRLLSASHKPVEVLSESQLEALGLFVPPDTYIVKNFVTSSDYALGFLPKSAPLQVTVVVEEMNAGMPHFLLRLRYAPNNPAYFRTVGSSGEIGELKTIHDFMIEFSHQPLEGNDGEYSVVSAVSGQYALQARILTSWFKYRYAHKLKRKLKEFSIPLAGSKKADLLRLFLERAQELQKTKVYNLFTCNCSTEMKQIFQMLEAYPISQLPSRDQWAGWAFDWHPEGFTSRLIKTSRPNQSPKKVIVPVTERK